MRLRRRHWNMRAMQQHFAVVMCLLLAITLCLVQIPVSYAADESEYAQEMADDPESPQNRMYTDKTTSGTAGSVEEPAAVVMQDNPYYLGIDVSYWNGESIDWDKVRAAGVQFVFVRVGYAGWSSGSITADYMYKKNIINAYNAGLRVGVYIYSQATTPAEARAEADFVVDKIEPYRQYISMPVVMDMESPMTYGASNTKTYWAKGAVSKAQVVDNYKAFAYIIRIAGYTPMFYTYTSWITEHIGDSMSMISKTGDPFWIAEYPASVGAQPPLFSKLYGSLYKYEFWQYSSSGSIAGISSNVDCNRWYTDDIEKYSPPDGSWSKDNQGWCYVDENGIKMKDACHCSSRMATYQECKKRLKYGVMSFGDSVHRVICKECGQPIYNWNDNYIDEHGQPYHKRCWLSSGKVHSCEICEKYHSDVYAICGENMCEHCKLTKEEGYKEWNKTLYMYSNNK